jgi:hypothetical protein
MKQKFFKNDDASVAYLAAALFFSLMFSSIVLAYFSGAMGLNIGIVQVKPLTSIESYSSEQNFKGGTYDLGTLSRTGHTEWVYNENVGLILQTLSGDLSSLYILNINPDSSGTVKNHYTINNSVKAPYAIILEGGSGYANNMVLVGDTGLYTTYNDVTGGIFGYLDYFPYANADKIEKVQITTEYKRGLKSCPLFSACQITKQPSLKITFNGVEYNTNKLNVGEDESVTAMYGGIAGISTQILTSHLITPVGLTLEYFRSDNPLVGAGETTDPLTQIASFITSMLAVIIWQIPTSIMPLELQMILIGSQETALLICLVVIIRGGGI